jgi:hypothetical protein
MQVEQSIKFIHTLSEDVNKCVRHLNERDNTFSFWARAYVRAFGSFIEGAAASYREVIVSLWTSGAVSLSVEQQLFFLNLDWRVTSQSRIETIEKKISTTQSLKCLFEQLSEVVPGYTVDFGTTGWENILAFYVVRDGLTHPKRLSSLEVSEEQVKVIEIGRRWFAAQVRAKGSTTRC